MYLSHKSPQDLALLMPKQFFVISRILMEPIIRLQGQHLHYMKEPPFILSQLLLNLLELELDTFIDYSSSLDLAEVVDFINNSSQFTDYYMDTHNLSFKYIEVKLVIIKYNIQSDSPVNHLMGIQLIIFTWFIKSLIPTTNQDYIPLYYYFMVLNFYKQM